MLARELVKSGDLKHLVSITDPAAADDVDDFGYPLTNPIAFQIRIGVDSYKMNRAALSTEDSQVVVLHLFSRFDARITPKQQLIVNDITYEIKSVENVNLANRRMNIQCVELRGRQDANA